MKCLCGYEQKEDFERYSYQVPLSIPRSSKTITLPDLFVCPRCGTLRKELTNKLRLCGDCDKTDGMCYTSNPPQVRCIITGEFHYYSDHCNVNQGE